MRDTEGERRNRETKDCPLGTKEDEQGGERRASSQAASFIVSFCVVGGRKCRYLFSYKEYQLCHYEVDGKGCAMEKGKDR